MIFRRKDFALILNETINNMFVQRKKQCSIFKINSLSLLQTDKSKQNKRLHPCLYDYRAAHQPDEPRARLQIEKPRPCPSRIVALSFLHKRHRELRTVSIEEIVDLEYGCFIPHLRIYECSLIFVICVCGARLCKCIL